MSHTYAQNVIHVVFSTKDRRKLLSGEIRSQMWAYTAGICKKLDILVLAVGGMEDHIHFLLQIPPTLALAYPSCHANLRPSSLAHREEFEYGAFSVSSSIVPLVIRYLQNQEAHHRGMSFDAEFLALLKKHGMEFDPRFVFG